MDRLAVALVLAALAVGFALVVQRRRADPPSGTSNSNQPPAQLDRSDFERPDAPWLVGVFTSATCSTCAAVWDKASVLASDDVVVQQVEAVERADLHRRYQVGAVPIVVIADDRGVVRDSFLGPVSATHLWAALAELRDPGSVPPGCTDHDEGPEPG